MRIIALSESGAGTVGEVGGKAAGLGEMIRLGLTVPDGFAVSPEATADEIAKAYDELAAGSAAGAFGDGREGTGGEPRGVAVAVRSSATVEDSPDASYAGQMTTELGVSGTDAVLAAVERCRSSATGDRAVAYRRARGEDGPVRMGVVVQRMVDAAVAGVLFTADPVTGRRTTMLVDAAPGLGTTVVDGAAPVDHYVFDDGTWSGSGCVPAATLTELQEVGSRLQDHFGAPQDVEWAIDRDGTLWLLQTRPITTLFPLPPPSGKPEPRVYLEFGHVQGMLQPVTPMGMSTLKALVTAMLVPLGIRVEITDIGGRLYGDLTDLARDPIARKRLTKLLAVDFGPRAQAAMTAVLADPRFAPHGGKGDRATPPVKAAGKAVTGILGALARPGAARRRLFAAVDRIRDEAATEESRTRDDATTEERRTQRAAAAPNAARATVARAGAETGAAAAPVAERAAHHLRSVRDLDDQNGPDDLIWPIAAGMLAASVPAFLLKGVATQDEIHAVLAGMPHNVTLEMDLALWRLAQNAGAHRDLLLGTPPAELAARYRNGELPEVKPFLDAYGHRGAAEVDLGVPRWEEDPAPVFAALANYLRVTDPDQAPDRRFARAAAGAEQALRDLTARARRRRPVRGRLAAFLLGRARELAGLREAGKFAGLYRLREMRRALLLAGDDLTAAGLLDDPADIMFLTLDEADDTARNGTDRRAVIDARKAVHRREMRRRTVPVALLSDGTDVESLLPRAEGGVGASPGRVTGPARVVEDPATAHVEPGEILVAATTDPGWTPLFLTAAGLVTETGAIMAHGPTVAREYGIPAVISVPDATRRIRTGQIVTVDGRTGAVIVEEA